MMGACFLPHVRAASWQHALDGVPIVRQQQTGVRLTDLDMIMRSAAPTRAHGMNMIRDQIDQDRYQSCLHRTTEERITSCDEEEEFSKKSKRGNGLCFVWTDDCLDVKPTSCLLEYNASGSRSTVSLVGQRV